MRTHEVPVLVEALLGHAPKQVRIAHGRKDVVRLHAVVAVVRSQIQKLGQITVPGIQIHRHSALAHTQLIDRHGGVVDHADPANHAARNALEAADGPAGRAHLAQVHAHAATVLADLREVIDAAVDAHQAVRNRVDETAGELVVGLAGIAQRRRGHGHLKFAEHIVEPLDPGEALRRLLVHGEVQRDAEEHLLRALQGRMVVRVDYVTVDKQVEARVCEQLVALGHHEGRRLFKLRDRIGSEDVFAVQTALGEVAHQLPKRCDAQLATRGGKTAHKRKVQKARGDHLPTRGLLTGEFNGRTDERAEARVGILAGAREGAESSREHGQVVGRIVKVALDTGEGVVEVLGEAVLRRGSSIVFRGRRGAVRHEALFACDSPAQTGNGTRELDTNRALLGPLMAVEDVAFRHLEMAALHERALNQVLNPLDTIDGIASHGLFNAGEKCLQLVGRHRRRRCPIPRNQTPGSGLLVSHVFEGTSHRLDDLRPVEALAAAVPLLYEPHIRSAGLHHCLSLLSVCANAISGVSLGSDADMLMVSIA